jgi:hypothetical protein
MCASGGAGFNFNLTHRNQLFIDQSNQDNHP